MAHHVSGIVLQARAARSVAETDPKAAADAMATVESAATEALGDMRDMVRILRSSDMPDTAPRRSLADLNGLAAAMSSDRNPQVVVEFSGDLDHLGAPVEAGLYRVAQEAVTNAIRHARHASKIVVRVDGSEHEVELTVSDDGAPVQVPNVAAGGFGLIGMAERAAHLDGSLDAGPGPAGGWIVRAQFPKLGARRL